MNRYALITAVFVTLLALAGCGTETTDLPGGGKQVATTVPGGKQVNVYDSQGNLIKSETYGPSAATVAPAATASMSGFASYSQPRAPRGVVDAGHGHRPSVVHRPVPPPAGQPRVRPFVMREFDSGQEYCSNSLPGSTFCGWSGSGANRRANCLIVEECPG